MWGGLHAERIFTWALLKGLCCQLSSLCVIFSQSNTWPHIWRLASDETLRHEWGDGITDQGPHQVHSWRVYEKYWNWSLGSLSSVGCVIVSGIWFQRWTGCWQLCSADDVSEDKESVFSDWVDHVPVHWGCHGERAMKGVCWFFEQYW